MNILKLAPRQCDFVFDLEDLSSESEGSDFLVKTCINALVKFPFVSNCRRLTLAGTSFPKNLSEIDEGSSKAYPRNELEIWEKIKDILRRPIVFGDYGIENPNFDDKDFRGIKKHCVNLRYTCNNYFIIYKGPDKNKFGCFPFLDLCSELIQSKHYKGPNFSSGDRDIYQCGTMRKSPGDPTYWREVGFGHHFVQTFRQVDKRDKKIVFDKETVALKRAKLFRIK